VSAPSPDVEAFAALVADLDYPMVVVTAAAGDQRSGCLVGFSTQCSIHPPRYWVGISEKNHTHGVALAAEHLGVHFLGRHDERLASLFGGQTGDEVDKLANVEWRPASDGVTPMLTGVDRWFLGRVLQVVDAGDHTGFLVDVVDAGEPADQSWEQLGFQTVKDIEPGHEP
jgi:flavin reductase (DIM6/NTAB) family NADH-FMN oxidoreductase RutF